MKLTVQHAAPEAFETVLPKVLEQALDYLGGLRSRPVTGPNVRALRDAVGGALPLSPSSVQEVLDTLVQGSEHGVFPMGSPRYFGYVVGGGLPVAVAADWLTTVWDQCGVIHDMSPLTASLEEICGEWLLDLFGLPSTASFAFTPGCTYSNLLCLTAARYDVLIKHGWDVRVRGLQGAPEIRVLVNEQIHKSVLRSLNILGLGGNIRTVRSDAQGRMLLDALDHELEAADGAPLIVCGQVGEINTGAVEFLQPLCERVHRAGGWVHLDAAFGLWAAATDLRHTLFQGLETADSWATDAHKWLNVPYDSGIAFVANAQAHRGALELSPEYLEHDEDGRRHPFHWGLGMSARSRVIPTWAVLRQLGREGVAEMINRHCSQARRFARRLTTDPHVRIVNDVVLNQVAVRFEPPGFDADTHTRHVAELFQRSGYGWASTSSFNGQTILRLSIINWATTNEDIDVAARSLIACHRAHLATRLPDSPCEESDPNAHLASAS